MTEEPRPRPFPEARPPHLPDALTRASPWLLFFGAVLALQLWRAVERYDPTVDGIDPISAVRYALSWIPSLAIPLIGAAVFRHDPAARRTMPLLVFGVLLLTLGEILQLFFEPIARFLEELTPPSETEPFAQSPAPFAFRVFTSFLAVFGLLYVGAGLSSARTQARRTVERPLAIWLAALAVVSTVVSVAGVGSLPAEASLLFVIQFVLGIALSGLVTLAWVYLATVTLGGWLAGDTPKRAWTLGAIGTTLLLMLRLILPVLSLVPFDPGSVIVWIVPFISYAGWLAWMAAFAIGLPTPQSSTVATDDPPEARQRGSATG
jgi:hypothetical protein